VNEFALALMVLAAVLLGFGMGRSAKDGSVGPIGADGKPGPPGATRMQGPPGPMGVCTCDLDITEGGGITG
jgi:hypothetical protein